LGGANWMRRSGATEGIESIEAFFQGNAYAWHRHDTYAIGCTLAGVQSFNYRGGKRNSLPGHAIVLHPDEPHDGQAGTDEGFRYRMIYIEPALIQSVLGGQALPFIDGGVTANRRLLRATEALLPPAPIRLDAIELNDALVELALALNAASGARVKRISADYASAARAREYLQSCWQRAVSMEELSAAAGRDRWSLSRDFRTFYGTSPHRYLTMRRLDAARRLMTQGITLADTAAATGFADQSHMTRHFKSTFGLTPARWAQLAGATAAS
jgi:AraC-like DNA-binding protein